jgi:hypothetical protein
VLGDLEPHGKWGSGVGWGWGSSVTLKHAFRWRLVELW